MRTILAIYENGVFKPQIPISLEPGARVEILVPEGEEPPSSEEMKRRYPNSWGVLPTDEAERIRQAIDEARQEIDPHAWS